MENTKGTINIGKSRLKQKGKKSLMPRQKVFFKLQLVLLVHHITHIHHQIVFSGEECSIKLPCATIN